MAMAWEGGQAGDWHFQGFKCLKHRGKRGSGHHVAPLLALGQGDSGMEGRERGGGPVSGPAHLAVPSVAASSVGRLFLPPAKSRRGGETCED